MTAMQKTSFAIQSVSPMQEQTLRRFGQRINRLGGNFAVVSHDGQILMLNEEGGFRSSKHRLQEIAAEILGEPVGAVVVEQETDIRSFGPPNPILAGVLSLSVPTYSGINGRVAALIDLGDSGTQSSDGLWAGGATQRYLDNQRGFLSEMLACLIDSFQAVARADRQMEMVGTELSQVYEELVLLHKLSTHMKVTESDANFLQLACDSLTEVAPVEGIAIVVERWVEHERKWMVVAGSGIIELGNGMAGSIFARLREEIDAGREALLDSDVFSVFKYDWPETVRNIIAVPLHGKDSHETHLVQNADMSDTMIGYMVAVNALQKQDFDSTDIKLFNSVANRCAVFIENGRLFGDLQELFMGSLRALTSSIDAKDGYTHGHSERVALICRWIAERAVEADLLSKQEAEEAYFAGLLHDIGKIGIEDWVLRKEGPLTAEELERIHNHPSIGAGILRGIKQMRDIVPGVLHHHERYDGKGYPHGLAGEDIPVLGRIVGLADSFDAMTSRRSYRNAMSLQQATNEIRKHLGEQFDPELGRLFLESDVERLTELMQGGSDLYYGRDVSDYGATAVGTLIR